MTKRKPEGTFHGTKWQILSIIDPCYIMSAVDHEHDDAHGLQQNHYFLAEFHWATS